MSVCLLFGDPHTRWFALWFPFKTKERGSPQQKKQATHVCLARMLRGTSVSPGARGAVAPSWTATRCGASACRRKRCTPGLCGRGLEIGTQNGTLANGNVDSNLRSPGGLILIHSHVQCGCGGQSCQDSPCQDSPQTIVCGPLYYGAPPLTPDAWLWLSK